MNPALEVSDKTPEMEPDEIRIWWDSLTEAEKQIETKNLQVGLDDIDA